jgi:hypothetical protein
MLAISVLAAIVLALAAGFFAVIEHEGGQLTKSVADIGGYVAIAGLVLGLPALVYAMVTDSAVKRIEDKLGASKGKIKDVKAAIDKRLSAFKESLPKDHFIQVFVPEIERMRLIPIYDPGETGPESGWGIDENTPQAITGSAWVGRKYLWGAGDELKQSKLRLTAEQLKRYEDLKAVAAAPILDPGRMIAMPNGHEVPDVIGVLTVFSTVESSKIGTDDFEARHQEAADSLVSDLEDDVPEEGALTQDDLSP